MSFELKKTGCFNCKKQKIGHAKTALAAKVENFFLNVLLCFVQRKDYLKMNKIVILSSYKIKKK
jgi:hypothetical protein